MGNGSAQLTATLISTFPLIPVNVICARTGKAFRFWVRRAQPVHFTVEAGGVYYFRAKDVYVSEKYFDLKLEQIDRRGTCWSANFRLARRTRRSRVSRSATFAFDTEAIPRADGLGRPPLHRHPRNRRTDTARSSLGAVPFRRETYCFGPRCYSDLRVFSSGRRKSGP